MSMKKNQIFVLNETEEKKNRISEPVLIFLVLAGILLFLRDFSYSVWCLAAAFFVGAVVTVLYCITERSEKAAGRMKTILYVSGIALFLVTITVTTQGILQTVFWECGIPVSERRQRCLRWEAMQGLAP